MTHILDTDHLSILERRMGTDYAVLVAAISAHAVGDVGMAVVTIHEQVLGCNAYIATARNPTEFLRGYKLLDAAIEACRTFPTVPFDSAALAVLDDLKSRKVRLKPMDLRIAATALANNLILVTRNVSDFNRVPGLQTEDWTK